MTKSPGRTIKKDYFHRNPEDLPSGPTGHLPGSVLSGLPKPHPPTHFWHWWTRPLPGTPLPLA